MVTERLKKYYRPLILLGLIAVFALLLTLQARGATYTWDGGGGDNNWSTCANWTSDTCPTGSDIAKFDSSSTTDAVVDASFAGSVAGIDIASGYTGTIRQERNLTIGGSGFSQADGTWIQGTTTFDINSGNFSLSGGTFKTGVGTNAIEKHITISGGTLTASSSRIFDLNGGNGADGKDATISCTGPLGVTIDLSKGHPISDVTLASGCEATTTASVSHIGDLIVNGVLHLGTNPSINGHFTNNGTTTATGSSAVSVTRNFTQNGALNFSASSTFNFNGGGGGGVHTTLSCSGPLGVFIDISKTHPASAFTLASGCEATTTDSVATDGGVTVNGILHMGTTFDINGGHFTNNGTTTATGTFNMFVEDNFTQNGVFDFSSTSVITFNGNQGGGADTTLSCTGDLGVTIDIAKTHPSSAFALASGCSVQANPVSTSGGVTINGTYATEGNTLSAGGLTIGSTGTLRLHGDESLTSPSLSAGSTVDYYGTGTYSSLIAGTSYTNLSFTGGGTYNIGSAVTVSGDLTLSNGSAYNATDDITLAGDLLSSGNASLNQTSGTFTLNGSGEQTVTGTSTFNNFTKTVTATSTVFFGANQEQIVSGILTLQGDSSNTLYVKSTATGTQWKMDMQSLRILEHLTISDGNNTNAETAYCDTGCSNGGNNTNINFTADPDGGKVYWDGGGGDTNWSTCANWKLDTCPIASVTAAFDDRSVKNATIDAAFGGSVQGLSIESGYTGTITGDANLTIGSDGFTHAGGTYTHSSGTVTFISDGTLTASTTTTFNGLTFGAPDSAAGLLSHWKLDDNAGNTTVTDEQGAYTGTASGNTSLMTTATRKRGTGAFNFDGTDDYVDFGDISQMDTPSAFSVSLWFRRDLDNNDATNHAVENVLVAQSSTNDNDNLEIGTDGSSLDLYLDTTGADTLESYDLSISDGTWYHLVVTYDSSRSDEVEVYLNNSLAATSSTWGGSLDSSVASQFSLGVARPQGDRWGDYDGIIDDVRLYTSAITAADVSALYGGNTLTLASSTLDIDGGFTLGGGNTLDVSSTGCAGAPCNIELAGDWTNNNGTFQGRTATVTLDGVSQTISGDTTFPNLAKVATADETVFFEASSTQTITDNLVLQGDSNNAIRLKSTATGTQYRIDMPTSRTLEFLIVQDANNIDATEASCTNGCLDGGNNTNWDFGSSAYHYWDGGGADTNWSTCDNWLFNTCPDASTVVAFDSRSTKNATIDASFAGEVQGLRIESGYTGAITSNRSLTVGSDGFFQEAGTFTAPASTLSLGGSLTHNGGTFSHNSGLLTVTADNTITATTTTAFNDVTFGENSATSTLLAYWKFDETSAGTFADETGNGYTGTGVGGGGANNTPQPDTSVPSGLLFSDPRSLDFDGSDDYVDVPAGLDGFENGNPDFTVSMWVYVPTGGGGAVISEEQSINNKEWFISVTETAASLTFVQGGGSYITRTTSDSPITADAWNHVAWVVERGTSNTVKIYVNGTESTLDSSSVDASWGEGNAPFRIAQRRGPAYFTGKIDDLKLYSTNLSASDITALADGGEYTGSGPVNVTLAGSTFDANGSLSIIGGSTLDTSAAGCSGSACDIEVAGNWTNNGTFTARDGTVTLDGTSQAVTGSTVFWDLTKSVSAADTITFTSGDTVTVKDTLTLKGVSGNLLTATSSGAAQWTLNANTHNSTVEYVDVNNSNSISDIDPMYCDPGCVDAGNNTNWLFEARPEARQRWRIDGDVRFQGDVRMGQ